MPRKKATVTTPDPNLNATPQSVADSLAGTVDGSPLSFREVAMLAPSEIFSLGTSYPFPEGPNTSTSVFDVLTTLGKILTRTFVASDGKTYDLFDAVMTILNAHLAVPAAPVAGAEFKLVHRGNPHPSL